MTIKTVQTPKNPIPWEQRFRCADIKAGDKVWLSNSYDYPCNRGIHTVSRITDSLIVVDEDTSYSRRFRRQDGFLVGKHGSFSDFITGIATDAEVAEYELTQKQKKEADEKRQQDEAAARKLEQELDSLFNEGTYIQRMEHGKPVFNIVISGLSEQEVRVLAPIVNKYVEGVQKVSNK